MNLTTAVNSLLRIDVVPNAISERNRNLIKDVLLGESNQELAGKYGISDTMVKNIIKDVFHHLGEIYTKVLAWQESEELYHLVFELMDVISILLQRLDIYKQYAPEPEYMDWMDFEHRSRYDIALSEIGLSPRVCQSLRNADVYTLGDLVVFLERDLCKFKNMGSKGIEEIKSLVAQKGMHLGMRIKASPLRADWTYKLYYINSNH